MRISMAAFTRLALLTFLLLPLLCWAGATQALLDGHPHETTAALQAALDPVLAAGAGELDLLLAAVGDRTENDTAARTAVEALTHHVNRPGAPEAQRAAWASALVRALALPEASVRRLAFDQLKRAGSAAEIPRIAPLLRDPDSAGLAVQTLLGIGWAGAAEPAAQALRLALGAMPSEHRPAAVTALGLLQDGEAADLLLALTAEKSGPLREAALWALARIGDPDAEKRLLEEAPPGFYGVGWSTERLLLYLRRLNAQGHERQARKLLATLLKRYPPETHPALASALLHEAHTLNPSKSTNLLLSALGSADAGLRETATALLAVQTESGITGELAGRLSKSEGVELAALMEVLARRGGREAYSALSKLAATPGPARGDALAAMSRVDFESALPHLVSALGSEDEALRQRAQSILATTRSAALAPFIKQVWKTELQAPQRLALLKTIAERRERGLVQLLLDTALSNDEQERKESLRALEVLAGPEQIPALLELLSSPKDPGDRKGLQPVILAACSGIPGATERVAPILQAHSQSAGEVRVALLELLRALGGSQALAAVQQDLGQPDGAIAEAAQRALAGWTDWEAAPLILETARQVESVTINVLLVRGWMRLAQEHWKRPLDKMDPGSLRDVLGAYTEARAAATREEERNAIDEKLKLIRDQLSPGETPQAQNRALPRDPQHKDLPS